jgi:hypothetical protein
MVQLWLYMVKWPYIASLGKGQSEDGVKFRNYNHVKVSYMKRAVYH